MSLSPLLLSTLRATVARLWPDFARAGVPAGVGIGVNEEGGIIPSEGAADATCRAIDSLTERLEDDGWIVYRMSTITPRWPGWYVTGIVVASERDPSSPGGIARGNALAAERARRHGPRRAAMGDPRGAKWQHAAAVNRMARGK